MVLEADCHPSPHSFGWQSSDILFHLFHPAASGAIHLVLRGFPCETWPPADKSGIQ